MRFRVLLQNRETKQYLAGNDQWMDERREGRDFETLNEAIAYAQTFGASKVDVVLEVDGGEAIIPI
jgi:hypothetical protein